MATEIFGSKMKTFASEQTQNSTRGFGQNGYAGSSSEPVGKAKKLSETYSKLATDVNASDRAGSWQTRHVSAAPIKTNPGTRGASAGGKVPSGINRAK